jgi:competence protein ComEC
MSQGATLLTWQAHWRRAAGAAAFDWIEAERGRFALWLPVFMLAGDALYFALMAEPPAWVGPVALAVGAAATLLGWRMMLPRAAGLAVFAAALGFAVTQFAAVTAPPLLAVPRHAALVTGQVRAVEALPTGSRVTLIAPALNGGPPEGRRVRIRLRAEDEATPVPGDRVRLRAILDQPSPPAYPGGWDLQRDDFFSGLGAYGFAVTRLAIVAHAPPAGLSGRIEALREAIAARIAAVVPDDRGAICTVLLTGLTAGIPEADRAAFRDSGLAHLLAIAGLHIGIVMGLIFGLTRLLLAAWERAALHWPTKSVAAVAALAAGGFYMLLTGAHVPIMRSFAMACVVTLGIVVGRRALSLRGLALAMAMLLLIAPAQAMGVSFQMSFSAVLALIAGYEALRPALLRLRGEGIGRRLLHHVAMLAITSALAGTASAPFAAYHFGVVQLYNVLANVLAVPITAVWIMPAGLAALALMPLHAEALALWPMAWGVGAVLWIGRTVSALPAATFFVPHAPGWGLAVAALGIAWLGIWRTRVRLAGIPAILLGLASPAFVRPPDALLAADGRLAALHADGAMFAQERYGSSAFTLDAWRRYFAAGPPRALPDAPLPGLACDARACVLRPDPQGPAATLLLGAANAADCGADVLLSLRPVRLDCPGDGPLVVDRFDLWRDGAYAVWLDPHGVRIVSDRDARGARPWVPPAPE